MKTEDFEKFLRGSSFHKGKFEKWQSEQLHSVRSGAITVFFNNAVIEGNKIKLYEHGRFAGSFRADKVIDFFVDDNIFIITEEIKRESVEVDRCILKYLEESKKE